MKASIRELRSSTKSILSAVGRGDKVIITYRGKPCAQLLPLDDAKGVDDFSEAESIFGIWKDNKDVENVDTYVRGLRKGRFA